MIIFRLIKNLLDLIYFCFSIIYYKLFQTNSDKAYLIFIKLFSLYGNKVNKYVHLFLKKKKQKIINDNYFLKKKINNDENIDQLKRNGYLLLPDLIDKQSILNFKQELKKYKGFYSSDNFKKEDIQLDLENPLTTQFHYYSKDLIEMFLVQKLLLEENILNLIQNYFKSLPIIYRINCWYNFKSIKPDASAAQYWHFDFESTKWLKVFIFLDDCNLENGPHEYIKTSHNNIPEIIRNRGYKRIKDDEVNNIFSPELKKKFIVKKGDVLIEDTIGLHKGNIVKNGRRGVLQLVFTASLFGGKNTKINIPSTKIQEFESMMKKYPILFSNFND